MKLLKERIMENVIMEALEEPIFKISTRIAAKKSDTSEANLFKMFGTKNNLLIECFWYIEDQARIYIGQDYQKVEFKDFAEQSVAVRAFWKKYLEFFVNNIAYAHFSEAFRKCVLFDKDSEKKHIECLREVYILCKYIFQETKAYLSIPFNMFWGFVIDTTLMIAVKMAKNDIQYNDENVNIFYHLIFDGINNILTMN